MLSYFTKYFLGDVNMNFYQLLQLGPQQLKQQILEEKDLHRRNYLRFILFFRSFLIVCFALIFVIGATLLFGKGNSSVAVGFFCLLLQSRFVNYGYNIFSSIFNMFLISVIVAFDSLLAPKANPFLGFVLNFGFLLFIIFVTCDNPKMGNVAVYVDTYLFSTFLPPQNIREVHLRFIEVAIGFVICSIIFIVHHANQNKDVKFRDVLKHFSLKNKVTQWQLRLAFGISLVLFIGQFCKLPRYFWLGISALSILSIYEPESKKIRHVNINNRVLERIFGIVIGSLLFGVIYTIFPAKFNILIGPLGGLFVGFSATYRWSTVFNCLGALMMATSLYGANASIILRIFNNILGCIVTVIFMLVIKKFVAFRRKAHIKND